ncbi:MAG: SGNH/GDSL hydrolase family protein [Sulfitobacter sp.]|nr:SGNH/GDSL hydrolase family protein [Sulfitobacter sp.]
MFDLVPRVALSPILVAQALTVRRRAKSLPEANGPRSGMAGDGPPLHLRIIGDSSAAGVGADTQDEALAGQTVAHLAAQFTVHWSLDAITGATTRSTLSRLAERPPAPTDIVITALGVNDVTRLVRPRVWLELQQRLHARIAELYAPKHIYLSGVPPLQEFPLLPNPLRWTLARQGRAFEALMARHAGTRSDLTYMPFALDPRPELVAEDGFHPSPDLYAIWGKEMASRILSDWPRLAPG